MDWRDLTGRYGDRVYLIVRSIVRDDALSRDASQEALLKIGRALNGHSQVKDYESWVLTVASNAARDALRRKARRRAVPIERDVVDERGIGRWPMAIILPRRWASRSARLGSRCPVP